MPQLNPISFNTLISAYSRSTRLTLESVKLFTQLGNEGLKPDGSTFTSLLQASSLLEDSILGSSVHTHAIRCGFSGNSTVQISLLGMYSNCGDLESAAGVFSYMVEKESMVWNSIARLKPSQATIVSLLSSCSHCGFIDEMTFLWNCMRERGLRPMPKHYSCMVSLLSRAGLFKEAEEMILESPFSGNHLDFWWTLLSSCIISNNLELGVCAAEWVLSMDGDNGATHMLLTNLYAAAGKWDEVTRMRRNIRELMFYEDPGLSWVRSWPYPCIFLQWSIAPRDWWPAGWIEETKGNMLTSEKEEIWHNGKLQTRCRQGWLQTT